MPIDSKHPLYDANAAIWKRCRDCYAGEDAVKAAGTDYLPRVSPAQLPREYEAYKQRASYYEAVARTVDGFVGAISRKPHTIELPAVLASLETRATEDGRTLVDLIKSICAETLLEARGGILVDLDDTTQAPYLAFYPTEAIINWDDDGVVLAETVYEPDGKDPFKRVGRDQLRHVRLKDGRYTVTVWQKQDSSVPGSPAWVQVSEAQPNKRGAAFDKMPWFVVSTTGAGRSIPKPPLLGLVNTSLSHYRTSADLEHGRHFTALPTLYITGMDAETPVEVGAAAVIKLSDVGARAGYAEFTGQGLRSLETALSDKEHQMAMLGAAIVAGGKKGVEAAETARIRTSGENSLLLGVVSTVEEALTGALQFAALWVSPSTSADAVVVKLNRDFIDHALDPQTLAALLMSVQAGRLSQADFLFALQQAEMLRPETDIDEEADRLQAAVDAAKAASVLQPELPAAAGNPGGMNEPETHGR